MITQLPRWVEFGAFLLAFIAGTVNAIGLLGFDHQSISHLSGSATQFGTSVFHEPVNESLHLFGILVSFLFGAILSGALLQGTSLKLGKHYDTALVMEAVLLFISLAFLYQNQAYGHYFASAACGLQNAFATTFSGAIVRTTHVTGVFTDLGIMLGQWLRGAELDKRKAKLFVLIISGFIFGGVLGAILFKSIAFMALLVPAFICISLALVYRVYVAKQM